MAHLTNTLRRDVELRGVMPSNHPLLEQCDGMSPRQVFQKLLTAAAEKDVLFHIVQATEGNHPLAHSLRAMDGIQALHFLICSTRNWPSPAAPGAMPVMPTGPATSPVTSVAPSMLERPVPACTETLHTPTLLNDDELSSFMSPIS